MNSPIDFQKLAERFQAPGILAIVLMGSHAAGEAGPFSDVDLMRFLENDGIEAPGAGSYLIDGRLVVVGDVGETQLEDYFTRPEVAVKTITGLRVGRALVDPQGIFKEIQARAKAFTWDDRMQEKANLWASREMVGWIEEVHKGLEGRRRGDIGRMLNARFGFSWGLSRVMQTHKGVLISGDNAFFDEVAQVVGMDSKWVKLRRTAFGIEDAEGHGSTLRQQIEAGLRLYVETARLLDNVLDEQNRVLVRQTVALIKQELG